MFLLLTYFTHFSSISVVDFGQVNVSWEKTKSISRHCSYLFKRFPVFCRICENLPFVTPDMHAFVCLSEDKNFFFWKCCRILKSIDINRIIAVKWFKIPSHPWKIIWYASKNSYKSNSKLTMVELTIVGFFYILINILLIFKSANVVGYMLFMFLRQKRFLALKAYKGHHSQVSTFHNNLMK